MKYAHTTALAAAMILLLPVSGMAATTTATTAVKDLPEGSSISMTGTVQDFDSEHSFMLHDANGAVKVDLSAAKSMVLKDGEQVDVTGHVNHTLLGTDVVAIKVSEDKGVGQQVGEAIDSITGQTPGSDARPVNVQTLPDSGLIKINGVVDSVNSGKKFTLKDSTGHVDVTIKSGESASLQKGTEVTVIGNVDKGLLGKSIDATEVDVRSSSSGTVVSQ